MIKKFISTAIITTLLFYLLSGCYSKTPSILYSSPNAGGNQEIMAVKYPELSIRTTTGELYSGKIDSLNMADKCIMLLPVPYWNVKNRSIAIDQISLIKLKKRKLNPAIKGFLKGFAWTYSFIFLLSLPGYEYDEDYKNALKQNFKAGVIGGLIGLLIGATKKGYADTKSFYNLRNSSYAKKIKVIMKIMGRL